MEMFKLRYDYCYANLFNSDHNVFTVFNACFSDTIPIAQNTIGIEFDCKVCVPGLHTACDSNFLVTIMNCGEFRVYKLKKPSSCPQAYCFGKKQNERLTNNVVIPFSAINVNTV